MTNFSDQLLADLMSEHGAALRAAGAPAARGGRPRPLRRAALLAGGAGITAAAITAALAASGGGASPAYAVTQHPDGTLTVAVSGAAGIAGANSRLRSLSERVVVVPERAGCPSLQSLPAPASGTKDPVLSGLVIDKQSATVSARGVPAGDLLVIAVSSAGNTARMHAVLTSPPAPACVSVPEAQPGSGNTVHLSNGQVPAKAAPQRGVQPANKSRG
jgi:hypothetical protein